MADDLLQGVLLSRKETKTLQQLKDMGNVKVPVQRKDKNYYLVALEEFLQAAAVPSISQLPDVNIVDPLPNQVLSIGANGLVENRFITFIASYGSTENAVIDEEFEKGSVIICFRGYSYTEYLPLIRRIPKTSYPDPMTFAYIFGAVYDGKVVEITCDPEDGWSVEETAVGGSGAYQLKGPWSSGENYVVNDFCTFGGNLYICKSDYTSDPESDDPSIDTTHWELFFDGTSGSSSTYQLKGQWSTSESYVLNDFCTFGDNLYICKSPYTADTESADPSIDTTHWELFFDGTSTYQLKGSWAAGVSYVMNDVCTFGGDLYICKSAYTPDSSSDSPSIDTDHWEIFFEASSHIQDNAYDSDENPTNPDNITEVQELTFFRNQGANYPILSSEERDYGILLPAPNLEADQGKVPVYKVGDQIGWETVGSTIQVINSLTSDSTTSALSAKQGKILKTEIDTKQSMLTSVTASDSTSGSTITLTIEQGGLSVIDLSAETTLTAVDVVLTNSTAAEIPLWWFKIKVGSDVTLSIKINSTVVGWLDSAITSITNGKTVEITVADGTACGGVLL